jgi:MRG-binding protein
MIALSEYLRNHGYDPTVDTHTRIPGIWAKLRSLYNLDTIDEREDYGDDDVLEQKYLDFSLPEEEFGKMMWMKGMAPRKTLSSPPQLLEPAKKRKRGEIAAKGRASTMEDTDEAKTSPARSTTVKAGRSRGGRKAAASRTIEDTTERQASKDTTMDEEEEENAEDTGEVDAVEDEQEDEDDGEEGTPSPKISKIAKVVKGSSQVGAQSKTRKSRRRK